MNVDDHPTMRIAHDDHERFKEALETYGAGVSGEEWDEMARHCGWSVEDTKTYAYWYMHQLFHESHGDAHVPSNHIGHGTETKMSENYGCEKESDETGVVRTDATHATSEVAAWSYEECILFDNLLIRYPLNGKNKEMKLRLEKIASMLPNKNTEDCMMHYARNYERHKPDQHLHYSEST